MLATALSALALAVTGAYAYENSSPLIFYSTSKTTIPSIQDLTTPSSIQPKLEDILSQCPTTNYLVIRQAGVTSDDYLCPTNTPFLRQLTTSPAESITTFMIRDVIGQIDPDSVVSTISSRCNKQSYTTPLQSSQDSLIPLPPKDLQNKVMLLQLKPVDVDQSKEDKKTILRNNDLYISSLIENYYNNDDYTLVYLTESAWATQRNSVVSEPHEYEAELPLADIMHGGELVRKSLISRKETTNQTIVDGPLFDKYQFFTPGIFMGLVVGLVLLAILYVGISALSSLQVTYGAFDKEQGQLAAKKQQ